MNGDTAKAFDRACESKKLTPSQIAMFTEYLINVAGLYFEEIAQMSERDVRQSINDAEYDGAFDLQNVERSLGK